jgi:NADH dehydrogenase FAD-containing subunit
MWSLALTIAVAEALQKYRVTIVGGLFGGLAVASNLGCDTNLTILLIAILTTFTFHVLRWHESRPSPREAVQKHRVIIVGGGFAGLGVASNLSTDCDVTVVDIKPFLEFTPSVHTVLGSVERDPHALLAEIKPLVPRARVVVAKYPPELILDGDELRVRLNNEALACDSLVIATGATYAAPIRSVCTDPLLPLVEQTAATRGTALAASAVALKTARRILVVGGGIVGVELAAELADAENHGGAARSPRTITIVASSHELVPDCSPSSRMRALEWLRTHGVRVVLSARVESCDGDGSKFRVVPKRPANVSSSSCDLASKDMGVEVLEADEVLWCVGGQPNTAWLNTNASSSVVAKRTCLPLDARGAVIIDSNTRRVVGLPRAFAVGDVASKPAEQCLASYAHFEGEFVAAAISCAARGKALPPSYTPPPRLVAVSLGARDGFFEYDGVPLIVGRAVPVLKRVIEVRVHSIQIPSNLSHRHFALRLVTQRHGLSLPPLGVKLTRRGSSGCSQRRIIC